MGIRARAAWMALVGWGCLAGCVEGGSNPAPNDPLDAVVTPDASEDLTSDEGGVALVEPSRREAEAATIAFGRDAAERAMASVGHEARVLVLLASEPGAERVLASVGATLDHRPESYVVATVEGRPAVIGRDATGAMYGGLELAERVRLTGASALPVSTPVVGAPRVPWRASNLFVVLPAAGEGAWWFRDPTFWREYLDLMARARMNFLDLHGMYNLGNTIFPNVLPYFARSASHPTVGVSQAEREENLRALNRVVTMASERGIRVGLMTYRSDTSLSGDPERGALDDAALRVYTREASEDLARSAPGLWRLGFRIAESGHDAAWYESTFIAGVRASGTNIRLYTRTWGSSKPEVLSAVRASGDDVIIEAKYNGEHFGPPYVMAGGAVVRQGWTNYSYEDYLEPPAPYTFVFQLRAGGTHRIFRHASYERIRRAVVESTLGGAAGFSLEPTHAYFPQRDYYHADPADRFSPWTFRRDELQYLLFGRLGYDPTTPERVFREALRERVGTDALWEPLQAASEIVPWIQSGHTCGPDHRNFAPEFEWGGPASYWASPPTSRPVRGACEFAYHGPFDTFAVASPWETAQDLIARRATTRVSSLEVARLVLEASRRARAAASAAIDQSNPEARDLVRDCLAQADLGEYFAHKLRGATALAVYSSTGHEDYLSLGRLEVSAADDAWRALARDTEYLAPFDDRLRMRLLGMTRYHWRLYLPVLSEDPASIDALVTQVRARPPVFTGTLPAAASWLSTERGAGPGLASLTVTPEDPSAASWTVSVTLARPVAPGAEVRVLWKPFSCFRDWETAAASGSGARFHATIRGGGRGGYFAVEVSEGASGWRYPDVLRETPYRVLAPLR